MKRIPGRFAALLKKEILSLCLSPATAAGCLLFLLGTGIPFFFPAAPDGAAYTFRQYAARIPFVSAIVLPALSMGIWSAERKRGTLRLLLALPVTDRMLVNAKFCALLSVWAVLLVLTLPVLFGVDAPGTGTVVTAYLLLFVYGAASLAMGQLFSVLFSVPAVAFIASAALLLLLNTIQTIPQALTLPVWAASACLRLSFAWHLEAATRGILDSRDFLFYLIPAAAALEANASLLRGRRIRP